MPANIKENNNDEITNNCSNHPMHSELSLTFRGMGRMKFGRFPAPRRVWNSFYLVKRNRSSIWREIIHEIPKCSPNSNFKPLPFLG